MDVLLLMGRLLNVYRDNQFSYGMYLMSLHNREQHLARVDNSGVLKAEFDAADELETASVDIRKDIADETDLLDYASSLNYMPPDIYRQILEQKTPSIEEVNVAFPLQAEFQALEEQVRIDESKLFFASPPPCTVTADEMTPLQRKAVELGLSTDPETRIMYICGKAGCGKTAVALKICEELMARRKLEQQAEDAKKTGRQLGPIFQCAAPQGKAASCLNAPTGE